MMDSKNNKSDEMIFTKIEILFFTLGVITTLSGCLLVKLNKKYKFNIALWLSFITGFLFLIFCLAWSISSIIEGEPRAASMGYIFFGLPGILLVINGSRLLKSRVKIDK